MKNLKTFYFCSLLILVSACSAHIPSKHETTASNLSAKYSDLREQMHPQIINAMRKHKITGMSIILIDQSEIVWGEGFGYADRQKQIQADVNTLYKAGSISKLFTATAIMQLVEQGKVDIDAPIQTYIPELKIKYHFQNNNPISLRHIMTHRSGLSGDKFAGMFTQQAERFDGEVAYLNSIHQPFAPGQLTAYSNLATDLQGVVVERVSGMKFEEYIEKNILTPLQMQHASFDDAKIDASLLSKPYRKNKEQPHYQIRNRPAGNLHVSALELAKFANMVLQKGSPIIQSTTLDSMLVPQHFESEYDANAMFGLNWVVRRPPLDYLGKVAWHNGGTINFMSSMVILTDHNLAVIVLSNSGTSMPTVEDTINKLLSEAAKIKLGLQKPKPEANAQQVALDFPSQALQDMPGTYGTAFGALTIEKSGSGIKGKMMGLGLKLNYHEDGWSSVRARLFGFIPIPIPPLKNLRVKTRIIDQQKTLFVKYNDQEIAIGYAVEKYAISPAWRKRLGTQNVLTPAGDFQWAKSVELVEDSGYLLMELKGGMLGGRVLLKPINDNMALIPGLGRNGNETIYVATENSQEVFHFSGYRVVREN